MTIQSAANQTHAHATKGTPSAATSWVLIVAGLLLLTVGILTTPWLQTVQLRCDRDLMLAQRDRLALKTNRHARFIAAVQDHDPTVLSRLRYERYRIIPQGATLVQTADSDPNVNNEWAVERWLDVPMINHTPNRASIYAKKSLLVHMAAGTGRVWVSLAGAAAIAGGTWVGRRPVS